MTGLGDWREVALLFVLLGPCACMDEPTGGIGSPCDTQADCAGSLVCRGGACQEPEAADGDADTDGDLDQDTDAAADGDGQTCELPCGAVCCGPGERCFDEHCIRDNGTCAEEEPCLNDTSCVDGVCVPFPVPPLGDFDPECLREPEGPDSFEPEIQCEWPGDFEIEDPSSIDIRVPPLVSDLDGDDVPEIVFGSYDLLGGDTVKRVRAIRGDTCEPVWTSEHGAKVDVALALADLDEDGLVEVCGLGSNDAPFCLDSAGTLTWEGHDAAGGPHRVGSNDGIAIANVDGAGPPEVVAGLSVFDGITGEFLRGRSASGDWNLNALADVDGDGHMEAVTGRWVYDLATAEEPLDWGTSDGFTAVAELTPEHEGPEVVVVAYSESRIRVQALDGTVVYQHEIPGGAGGPPTVADLDGDDQAEFATAGNNYLTAFDLDCVGTAEDPPDPARCAAPGAMDGVLWSQPSHEYTSGITGSSVFDFEGDGAVEVVYADECWARVYDGATGVVKFSAPHMSMTGIESPVVADVDGDFYTEIVVPHEYTSTSYVSCPSTDPLMPEVTREAGRRYRGITVYRDREDRWVPSRPLWSQHTEHYSQRFDRGSVPLVEAPSWESHNSYRQALLSEYPDSALWVPDLTVGGLDAIEGCVLAEGEDVGAQLLEARVCNRGTLSVAAGVEVTFHLGSADGETLCTTVTAEVLDPGECEQVSCQWDEVPVDTEYVVVAVVDPQDGDEVRECHEGNNGASHRDVCPRPPD